MEIRVLVGPGGAGKTDELWKRYRSIAQEDRTDSILVLLWNARDVRDWRQRVDLPWAGPLHVYTYFGWVQREIRANWPRLVAGLGGNWLEPEFLTVETSQFAMLRQLRNVLPEFANVVTSPERLAIQLGSCLVLASLNGIPRQEIGSRLARAMPDKDPSIFSAAQRVIDLYRQELEAAGALDYGAAVELYGELLQDEDYRAGLQVFRHLLVDDTHEQSPASHDFIEVMLEQVNSATLCFSTDGGHAGFFGADARGAWQRFGSRGDIRLLRSTNRQWLARSGALYRSVRGGMGGVPATGPRIELLHADLRSQLLDEVAERVVRLLDSGFPPAEIAVIAPMADKVLEHTLTVHLQNIGVPLNVLTKNRRLVDEPYVRAMMTLALLAHHKWELDWGLPDLAQSLQLLLKTDPVRAWLLGRQVREGRLLPLEVWQRERVGFKAAQGYDLLRGWLEEYRQGAEQPLDLFFQRVFGELLSRLPPARDDLVVCRQLMVSAQKFLATSRRFPALEADAGLAFMRLLSAGTVAAESLLQPATQEQAVVLSTPYAFISGHYHTQAQVWMDCTSRRWFQQDVRELINPHVLKSTWRLGEVWTDELNEALTKENGARVARALMRRCGEILVAAAANIDSQGFEQDGPLLEALLTSQEGGDGHALSSRSEGRS